MNTDVHVILVGGSDCFVDQIENLVSDREARWSRFLPDSEISQLNRSSGRPVVVEADTFQLLKDAIDAYHQTEGAFDPTVLGSMLAAGYNRSFELLGQPATGGSSSNFSSEAAGTSVVAAPGPEQIELLPEVSMVRVPSGVGIDLGGIAKGATADAAVAFALDSGAEGCCVNLGGDLRVSGTAPQPEGWLVEIDCPGSDETRSVSLTGGAVCTSTRTARTWGPENAEHHLRSPSTGKALDTGLASVVVIGRTATQAEVLTKVAMGAGVGLAVDALTTRGVTGLLITDEGHIVEVDGFAHFLTIPEAR